MRGILLDTNILIAQANPQHELHSAVNQRLWSWLLEKQNLLVSSQTLYEFYVAATRPKTVNGLGLTVENAVADIHTMKRLFAWQPDPPQLLNFWLELVTQHKIQGKPAHDARQAAWLLAHGLQHIYTLNVQDFVRFVPDVLCLD